MEKTNGNKSILYHPVDKGWAWMIFLSSFMVQFMSCGYQRSFGVLFVAFQEKYNSASALTSGIVGAQSISFCFFTLLAMNVLVQRFSTRLTCVIGCFLQVLAISLSGVVTGQVSLIVTQGVVYGAGHALIYCPTLFILSQYFDRHRPITTVLSSCGASLGGIAFPLLTTYLLDKFGLQGGLLLLSAMLLHQMPLVLFYTPPEKYFLKSTQLPEVLNWESDLPYKGNNSFLEYEPSKYDVKERAENDFQSVHDTYLQNTPQLERTIDVTSYTSENIRVIEIIQKEVLIKGNSLDELSNESNSNESSTKSDTTKSEPSEMDANTQLIIDSEDVAIIEKDDNFCSVPVVLKSKCFWILAAFFCTGYIGTACPIIFIPPLAKARGLSDEDASYLLTTSSITEIVGRLLPGLVLHFNLMRSSSVIMFPLVSLAVTYYIVPFLHDFSSILALTLTYGLLSSSFWALQTLIIIEFLGMDLLAPSLGFYSVFRGFTSGVSFPFSGYLKDLTGTYSTTFMFFGMTHTSAVAILLFLRCFMNKRKVTDDEKLKG